LNRHAAQFRDDHTYTLILRLHHNVIKTAIRTMSLAYSRISLADIAKKLRLESSNDAEYIIAKVRFINNLDMIAPCWLWILVPNHTYFVYPAGYQRRRDRGPAGPREWLDEI
jgi:hypothetical protein